MGKRKKCPKCDKDFGEYDSEYTHCSKCKEKLMVYDESDERRDKRWKIESKLAKERLQQDNFATIVRFILGLIAVYIFVTFAYGWISDVVFGEQSTSIFISEYLENFPKQIENLSNIFKDLGNRIFH